MSIRAVILAAGQGKRMHSKLPKVLHPIAGKPMLERVITTAKALSSKELPPVIIYGHQGHVIKEAMSHHNALWAEQIEQLGTGHAVLQALTKVNADENILILYGDVPLISEGTLQQLIDATPEHAIGMLTATLDYPTGYGRIKRDAANHIIGIVEEKDANADEKAITEVNSGVYLIPAALLKKWLPTLKNNNAQGEYYLTDVIKLAQAENISIHSVSPAKVEEIMGVNDRVQLMQLERFYQKTQAEVLMRQGVTIMDPLRLDMRGTIEVGKDVILDVNVIMEGKVVLGDDCVIGPNVLLRNVVLAEGVIVKANSVIDGAEIGAHAEIGPFARIRPGTILKDHTHIGNFVEIKNSRIDQGSKVNHLSYIGDSDIGKKVNIGAGTITCNYDGANKHKTTIADHVFIGSDSLLIAPVRVGEGATIAAGSIITKDAPAHQLTLTHRLDQRSVNGWERPTKS
ncbi:MAG: bifunctional UDP-N-acetylglucosamine diphosphorylase/glucosamine-1-phosphate N-acetyltransferase GlmU [Gammaproteobacteria bacterium]